MIFLSDDKNLSNINLNKFFPPIIFKNLSKSKKYYLIIPLIYNI